MNCQQAKLLIDAYADGELDAATVLDLEQHLKGCADCARALSRAQHLKKSLKQETLYFTAPAELRQRIKAALPAPAKVEARPSWNWSWNWLSAATSGAFAVCLGLVLVLAANRPSGEQQLAEEIVSSHVRSLMANHVMDVVSTDQHTVKPWFNGKLDFSPPVKDLAAQEFPLIGGRLDYLGGRTVAALIFQRHKHVINLFIWPASEGTSEPKGLATKQGYHLIHWADGGMSFWAVSDLNEAELMEFAGDFEASGR